MLTRTPELPESSDGPPHGARPILRRYGRTALSVLILVIATVAIVRHRAWETTQSALAREALDLGLSGQGLSELTTRMQREADPTAARIALAATLFDFELTVRDPGSPASAERLLATRELAHDALRAEPASWEAAMLLGATISLERSRARDTRIFSLARDWEQPLIVAGELAPAELQPRRLLAAAYLEVWPALAPEKRKKVEILLREAFLEPRAFERLFAPWVEIAGSLDRAATLLPDRPLTFKRLAETAFERKSWAEYVTFTEKYRDSLRAALERDLEAASAALAQRDIADARRVFSSVLAAAPVDLAFVPLVEKALAGMPPGPAIEQEIRAAEAWIAWLEPLCLVRDCPLSPTAIGRLGSLAGTMLGARDSAFVALAAEDLTRAGLLERRSDELWSETWAPYLTLRAQQLAAANDPVAARTTLGQVHRAFRTRLAWRALAERLGGIGTVLVAPGPPLARERWQAADWWFDRGASRLDLAASRSAAALRLEFPEALKSAVVLDLQWDGRALPAVAVGSGAASVAVPLGIEAGAHLLEIRVRSGDLRPAMSVQLD
ncbi:MAG: hypothetical protein ABI639_07330 [Thermoanaerobaculia bacterium]